MFRMYRLIHRLVNFLVAKHSVKTSKRENRIFFHTFVLTQQSSSLDDFSFMGAINCWGKWEVAKENYTEYIYSNSLFASFPL